MAQDDAGEAPEPIRWRLIDGRLYRITGFGETQDQTPFPSSKRVTAGEIWTYLRSHPGQKLTLYDARYDK
jgi:hypothetical protein